jgi:hypothetical protein
MAHADHFLSRLDRVSTPEVELALSLYNDPDLVAEVVSRARASENERIAVSLEHPTEGPFVILTRTGRFVTCLGRGMTLKQLPVVTRQQLDASARVVQTRRDLSDHLTRVTQKNKQSLRCLFEHGAFPAREDMGAIASLAPIFGKELCQVISAMDVELIHMRGPILRLLTKVGYQKVKRNEQSCEVYHRTYWTTAHLTMLLGSLDREVVQRMRDAGLQSLTRMQSEHRVLGSVLRTAWLSARFGKTFLGPAKEAYATETTMTGMLDAAVTLFAIAVRHTRLRAEVEKALSANRVQGPMHEAAKYFEAELPFILDDNDVNARVPMEQGADWYRIGSRAIAPGTPGYLAKDEPVPDALALPMLMSSTADALDPPVLAILLASIRYVARAKLEDLFFPDAIAQRLRRRYEVRDTAELLEGWMVDFNTFRKQRATAPSGPSRNGPCPCGSGKKYKRCCASD